SPAAPACRWSAASGGLSGLRAWRSPSLPSFADVKSDSVGLLQTTVLLQPLCAARQRARIGILSHAAVDVGERGAAELRAPGILGAQHCGIDGARPAVGAAIERARPALTDLGAAERRLRAVDRLHHVEQRDALGRPRETIAAARPGHRLEQV